MCGVFSVYVMGCWDVLLLAYDHTKHPLRPFVGVYWIVMFDRFDRVVEFGKEFLQLVSLLTLHPVLLDNEYIVGICHGRQVGFNAPEQLCIVGCDR